MHLFAQIFPSLDAAAVFHELCILAIEDRSVTAEAEVDEPKPPVEADRDDLLVTEDRNVTAEAEVDEPKPPVEAEDRDDKPPKTPAPLRRSARLMRKKAKAVVAEIGQPRCEKATSARLAGPSAARRSPCLRSSSAAVRRSTRARSKPVRYGYAP